MAIRARLLLASITAAALLLGCSLGAKPAGVSRADAIAAAERAVPGTTGVIDATHGSISNFETGQQVVPGNTEVWAVVLAGSFPNSCGPAPMPGSSPHPCPLAATSTTVLIDFMTGEFVMSFAQGSLVEPAPSQ